MSDQRNDVNYDDIIEIVETDNTGEAGMWVGYIGVRLLSLAQDPSGKPHYIIGRIEGSPVPWDDERP